jgi:arylsulfatase
MNMKLRQLLAHRWLAIALCATVLTACSEEASVSFDEASRERLNILLIVADDLGYSDIGPFGGEISTPILDRLAEQGMRFSAFHVLPTCSPTRAALLSGNDNHVAGMGVMAEFIYPEIADLPGYAGHLADQVATIPELLRQSGYHTYMAGKWHLGEDAAQSPFAHGFQKTFTMMNGGGSHWADMRPLSPTQNMIYRRNGERIDALPEDFYSSKNYTDALIEFIDSDHGDGKPFFAYLSYTAPHDPLHAPADYIAKYKDEYDAGWDVLAQQRLASLKRLGLVPEDINELPPNFMVGSWDSLSPEARQKHARDMEVYAAMVEYMDMSIGRLFEFLKDKGLYDNTLIVFFSDNGANGAHATAYPGNADGEYLGTFDNRLDNRGLPSSFIDMGPGWAGEFRAVSLVQEFYLTRRYQVAVDCQAPGTYDAGRRLESCVYPEEHDGRAVRQPIGKSFLPILRGDAERNREDEGVGYELFEMKAYIRGDWKLLRLPEPFSTGEWQLFDISKDPGEIHDLSDEFPEIKAGMIAAWQEYARANDVYDHMGRFDALYRKAYGTN